MHHTDRIYVCELQRSYAFDLEWHIPFQHGYDTHSSNCPL